MFDTLREKLGFGTTIQQRISSIDPSRLTEEELVIYNQWLQEAEENNLSVSGIAEHISDLKDILSNKISELSSDPSKQEENTYLKGRLANAIFMQKFINDKLAAQADLYKAMAHENAPRIA